jgi:lipopolysaccharide assembly protein A
MRRGRGQEARSMHSMNYKLILILVLSGLTVLFIIQNVVVVEVRFLFWSIAMSRSLLMFFLIAIGMIIGWLLHSFFIRRRDRAF